MNKDKILTTLLHTGELAFVMLITYILVTVLKVPLQGELLVLVLASLAKYSRVSGKDYVNNFKSK